MKKPNSVLIVRLSAIGDVIHSLPVLDVLRRELPDARIGWIVEELSAPLLQNHPQLDELYVIPKKRWRGNFWKMFFPEIRPFFRQVKADGWEVALDLHGLTKSGLVAWASGAPIRIGYGDEDGREINKLFTNRKVKPSPEIKHVVARNLALLEGLGITPPADAAGKLGILEEEREQMRARLEEAGWTRGERIAALNPGAGWSSKRWEPVRFAETGALLAKDPGLRPLILWGPREEPMRDEIANRLKQSGVEPIIAPQTRIRDLAVLISLCDLFIGGDTGPTHTAGLLDVPVVSIFGASDSHRNRPWPIKSGPALQREDFDCVPCWKTKCPLVGDEILKCLHGIEASRVAEAAREVYRQHQSVSS
ncbi:glycosyltransferase family 9 protein [bacterium]|nr:glycosyltransferase family 9 protein [bacterium]